MSRRLKIGLALAVAVAVAMLLLRGEDRQGEAGANVLFPGSTDRLDEIVGERLRRDVKHTHTAGLARVPDGL